MSRGKIKDLTGIRFGRLVAVAKTEERIDRRVVWECKCDCGNMHHVQSNSLLSGKTRSCGCLEREHQKKFGEARTTHHQSRDKFYYLWQGMKQRCSNNNHKNYKDYGGRGITVCDEWKNSFEAFRDYVSQLPHFGESGYTLDRINNDGNYEPGNVKWSTQIEQCNNRRPKRKKVS